MEHSIPRHIRLTSHPGGAGRGASPLRWGAADPAERGPVVASPAEPRQRNAIGSYSGAYAVYRALAVATRALARDHRPDLTDTAPAALIAPRPQWADPAKIVSLDPWGHLVGEVFAEQIRAGIDVRPTIAITTARIALPEIRALIARGGCGPTARCCSTTARSASPRRRSIRCGICRGWPRALASSETELRRTLFEETGGMFPELVTRPDLEVLLPPIGGTTVYLFGEVERLGAPDTVIACRVHDECNGSDVFGSDICTCRPYLVHGIEVCVETAQQGGVGIIVYNRKEGRALGEVTKFLVYNARKRQPGGDTRRHLFPPHRMRRRRAGHALSGTDAGRRSLARHPPDRPLGVDVEHEARGARGAGDRGGRAGRDPRSAGAARRHGRDRGKEGGRDISPRRARPTRQHCTAPEDRALDE